MALAELDLLQPNQGHGEICKSCAYRNLKPDIPDYPCKIVEAILIHGGKLAETFKEPNLVRWKIEGSKLVDGCTDYNPRKIIREQAPELAEVL